MPDPVILDLGSRAASAVKRLRHGRGELFDEVEDSIAELANSGAIDAEAQPVIIVVSASAQPQMVPMSLLNLPMFQYPLRANDEDDEDGGSRQS